MPSITIAIPARYESSRFPGKVLYPILNKALVEWTYERCIQCNVDEVVVLTEHHLVLEYLQQKNIPVLLTPASCNSGTERIASIVHELKGEVIINVQADEPLIKPEAIMDLIQFLQDNPNYDIATLARPEYDRKEAENPNRVKVVINQYNQALYFSRALIPFPRDGEGFWLIHLGIYGYRRKFLENFFSLHATHLEEIEKLEQLKFLYNGFSIGVKTGQYDQWGVDTPEDIKVVIEKIKLESQHE